MPNWVMNRVIVKGSPEDVQTLVEYVKEGEVPFSFDKIIPMPKGLDEAADEHKLSTAEKALLEAKRLKEFGYSGWYSWSIAKWGTKWGAVDAEIETKTEVELLSEIGIPVVRVEYNFDTAWDTCRPVLEALARAFPALCLEHDYIEEQPSFGGRDIYENGTCIQSVVLKTPKDIWSLSEWHENFEPEFEEDE